MKYHRVISQKLMLVSVPYAALWWTWSNYGYIVWKSAWHPILVWNLKVDKFLLPMFQPWRFGLSLGGNTNPKHQPRQSRQCFLKSWLVVYLPLWKMMEFVTWDDEIPNIWKKSKKCSKLPNHQPERWPFSHLHCGAASRWRFRWRDLSKHIEARDSDRSHAFRVLPFFYVLLWQVIFHIILHLNLHAIYKKKDKYNHRGKHFLKK